MKTYKLYLIIFKENFFIATQNKHFLDNLHKDSLF